MRNPYRDQPDSAFWKKAVADKAPSNIFPLIAKRFTISDGARVATAGSCFAQNVALHLKKHPKWNFVLKEPVTTGQPMFSAAYGNIYTTAQLLQLVREVLGYEVPKRPVICREDGRFVDASRPFLFENGFATEQEVTAAREIHLQAVRSALAECDVFVFTLGLTEGWISREGGYVFPVCPALAGEVSEDSFLFVNSTYEAIVREMTDFLHIFREINQTAKILLTVSPVPLTATYSAEHVLVATMESKSILRAACATLCRVHETVHYFPSYEIISSPAMKGMYFMPNLRNVKPKGVEHVMCAFDATYGNGVFSESVPPADVAVRPTLEDTEDTEIICDEERVEYDLPQVLTPKRPVSGCIMVLSNCATKSYIHFMEKLFPTWRIYGVSIQIAKERVLENNTRFLKSLQLADFVIGLVNLEPEVMAKFPSKTKFINIPGFWFWGFQPDIMHLKGLAKEFSPFGTEVNLVSQIAATCAAVGLSHEEAERKFCEETYESLGYFDYSGKKSDFFSRMSSAGLDLERQFSDWEALGKFTYIYSHGRGLVYLDLLVEAIRKDGRLKFEVPVEQVRSGEFPDFLEAGVTWPIYPEIQQRTGVKDRFVWQKSRGMGRSPRGEIGIKQFIKLCYRAFDSVPGFGGSMIPKFDWNRERLGL